jgi:hypothetical protein
MAVSTTNVRRYTTAGNVYFGVTKPADRVLMTHTAGVPTGGTDVGATIGAATFEYRPTINTTDIEQAYGGIAPYVGSESATLRFTCAEATYQNIQRALQQASYASDADQDVLKVGGNPDVVATCVAIISRHADQARYSWACAYSVVSMEGGSIPYKRGEPRQIAVTLNLLADVDRTIGDQLFQIVEEAW